MTKLVSMWLAALSDTLIVTKDLKVLRHYYISPISWVFNLFPPSSFSIPFATAVLMLNKTVFRLVLSFGALIIFS